MRNLFLVVFDIIYILNNIYCVYKLIEYNRVLIDSEIIRWMIGEELIDVNMVLKKLNDFLV